MSCRLVYMLPDLINTVYGFFKFVMANILLVPIWHMARLHHHQVGFTTQQNLRGCLRSELQLLGQSSTFEVQWIFDLAADWNVKIDYKSQCWAGLDQINHYSQISTTSFKTNLKEHFKGKIIQIAERRLFKSELKSFSNNLWLSKLKSWSSGLQCGVWPS